MAGMSVIHVALVSAYPTEAAARTGIAADRKCDEPFPEYRGIWRLPEPYGGLVHLFSDDTTEALAAQGWALVSSALPGDAPWTGEDA
jgi:hypothetical protein